jgi:HlyD family secretion protein
MTQNVVTYLVEVQTENRDGRLLPYLTANARFHVSDRRGVFLVPNSALRFSPPQQDKAPERLKEGEGRLWSVAGDGYAPIVVRIGGTDGTFTEVAGEGVREGVSIVTGTKAPQSTKGETTVNPFQPSFQKRR